MVKILTPTITVFDDFGKVDWAGNRKLIDHLVQGGVDGALVLGSTGEFPIFTIDERLTFLRFYMEYTAGRMELIAGTGCTSLTDTISLTNAAFDMGYKICAVITPYYYAMDQEQIFHYYDSLAKAVHGEIYLYNFPARTGMSITPETIRRLAVENKNIIGLKDSVPDTGHTNMVFRAMEGVSFTVFSGFDDHFMLNVANQGGGGICAMSNLVPELWSDLVRSTNRKDYERATKLYSLILKLMPIYNLDGTCAAIIRQLLNHRGLGISEYTPQPFNYMDEEGCRQAAKRLDMVLSEYQKMGGVLVRSCS